MRERPWIPFLGEEGWLRQQENAAKPPLKAQTEWSVLDNVSTSTCTKMTTPSAPFRWLLVFFLLAQPPLLSQEGNPLSCQ